MVCIASDRILTCQCSGSTEFQVFDPQVCPDAQVVVIDPPLIGKLEYVDAGVVRYTPCENVGVDTYAPTLIRNRSTGQPRFSELVHDSFSYTLTGVEGDPGVGVVGVKIEGDNCEYYEVLRCGLRPLDPPTPRKWVLKADAESMNYAFLMGPAGSEQCFVANRDCPSCVPPGGVVVRLAEMKALPDGCRDTRCFQCQPCGPCCFSSASKVIVSWQMRDADFEQLPPLWQTCVLVGLNRRGTPSEPEPVSFTLHNAGTLDTPACGFLGGAFLHRWCPRDGQDLYTDAYGHSPSLRACRLGEGKDGPWELRCIIVKWNPDPQQVEAWELIVGGGVAQGDCCGYVSGPVSWRIENLITSGTDWGPFDMEMFGLIVLENDCCKGATDCMKYMGEVRCSGECPP